MKTNGHKTTKAPAFVVEKSKEFLEKGAEVYAKA
jgi:hypothetical protein